MRALGAFALAVLLIGCSGVPDRPVSPEGSPAAAKPSHPIESVRLGDTMVAVQAEFGEPTTIKTVSSRAWPSWAYLWNGGLCPKLWHT